MHAPASHRPAARAFASRLVRILVRVTWQLPAFYGTVLLLGLVQLAWALIAVVVWHLVSEQRGRLIGRGFVSKLYRSCFRLSGWLGLMRVDAKALDAIDPREGMIIAPNHPSVMDALILISRLDNLNCIMKASVLDNVFLGAGARLAGYIRNDGAKRMLRLSAADLKRGGQLIVFPEGTRTVAAPVNPFKGGFAAMARLARVPVQTVILETDTPFLSKGWSILKPPPRFPMTFTARLGQRFEVDGRVDDFVVELHAYFADALVGARLGDLWDRPPSPIDDEVVERPEPRDDDASARPACPLTDSLVMASALAPSHSSLGPQGRLRR